MKNNKNHIRIKLFFEKWKKDYILKTLVSAIISFVVTVLFALYNGFLGVWLPSIWHGSICAFYILLVIIRGVILLSEKRNYKKNEREQNACRHRTFLASSIMLLFLNLALIVPISLMVLLEKPVNMGQIPAITIATYTTYKLVMASIHIRKQKYGEHHNILIKELRTINFIDALVSVLTLQNTLIMVNRTETDFNDMLVLSAVSSTAIYVAIVAITIHLFKMNKKVLESKS